MSGREVVCDDVDYDYVCWNSTTRDYNYCWSCSIYNQQITDEELTIALKYRYGSAVDVESVRFSGGDVIKMPKVINKKNNKQILNVHLWGTNTSVLNAQFFGNAAQHLKYFGSWLNDNLSVEASAFQNFAALEFIDLTYNGISSISPDAFRRLNKLVRLDLDHNNLTAINENLFDDLVNLERLDLSENQLAEVPDTAFENLHKLKKLYLESNEIEIVRKRMFHNNQQLQKINLEYNQIKVIESGAFSQLLKLSWLGLFENNCTNDIFINKSPAEMLAGLTICRPIESIEGQLIIDTNVTEEIHQNDEQVTN